MEFTKERLIDILEECLKLPDETDWVEFKLNNYEYNQLGERLSGLSNTACLDGRDYAFLIYGIEDGTLEIKGTSFNPDKENVGSAPFEFKLSQDISPKNISISIKKINYNGFDLVIFIVPSAIEEPTTFKSKSYIRISSGTTELSRYSDKQRKIWNNIYNKNFEKQIALPGLLQEEVFELLDIDNFFELLNINKTIGIEETINYLIQNKIIKKSLSRYDITNLGAILFANKLNKFESIKTKGVRIVVYDGYDKSANNKSHEGNKGYALGFEELLKYISLLIPSFEKIVDGRRVTTNSYPKIAIREFVANALIHQDLSIKGMNPIIEIYKDRIEITNPGSPLIDVNRFLDANQSRNEDLSDMMRKMKFCEKLGSGVDKAIISIEKEKLPAPKILQQDNYTKVILYSLKKIEHLSKEDRIRACFHCVIKYITNTDYMTNSSFKERMNIKGSHTIISNIISQTIESGSIKVLDPKNKANRYTKYVPSWHS
ncbi:MAG: ATP-binding protein [Candidatus Gracilibacteria bacterium]|nr:ATP-binding protein [Candidatus Gracilibacteria bacterium]